jgi:deoxyribonuclease V
LQKKIARAYAKSAAKCLQSIHETFDSLPMSRPPILAVDVHYVETTAFVAGVLFDGWGAQHASGEVISTVGEIEDYEPGSFYKRELPCIRKMLDEHGLAPSTIVIDGYVFLDESGRPGLGKRLADALAGSVEVIGVAKNPYPGVPQTCAVYRGGSTKPLYVTTTGCLDTAKASIAGMAGEHRMPVLLKRADQLCRNAAREYALPGLPAHA